MTGNQWQVKTEDQRGRLIKFFEKMELPDCGVLVEWCDADTKRSYEQCKLQWAGAYRPIATFLSEQSGTIITTDMVHAVAVDRFVEPIVVTMNGKTKRYPGSTAKLGKKAFSDYLEQVFAWGAEMGVWFE
jgi:hypothetical protein